jgi:hypothetical protein
MMFDPPELERLGTPEPGRSSNDDPIADLIDAANRIRYTARFLAALTVLAVLMWLVAP